MKTSEDLEKQEQLNAFFRSTVTYWKTIYNDKDVQPLMYVQRQDTTLQWIEELTPGPDFRILDIGCGAGMLSIELAARGFQVHAIDPVEEMVELVQQNAMEAGIADRLTCSVGNIYAIDAEDASFDLTVALGVFVCLDRPEEALREMMRVTKPGGHILFSTQNELGLVGWFDPLRNPLLRSAWKPVKSALLRRGFDLRNPWPDKMARKGHPWPDVIYGGPRSTDKLLARCRLTKVKGITLSFYPLTFLGHTFLPKSFGLGLAYQLERLADRGVPGLRVLGEVYLVLAKRDIEVQNGNDTLNISDDDRRNE